MDPLVSQGPTGYGTVANYGVTLGNIAGDRHEIIGTKIHVHAGPSLQDFDKDPGLKLLAELHKFLARQNNANDNQSMNSGLTTYDNDNKEIWREFRRDLIQSGVRSDQISKYANKLKAHLRELTLGGTEESTDFQSSFPSARPSNPEGLGPILEDDAEGNEPTEGHFAGTRSGSTIIQPVYLYSDTSSDSDVSTVFQAPLPPIRPRRTDGAPSRRPRRVPDRGRTRDRYTTVEGPNDQPVVVEPNYILVDDEYDLRMRSPSPWSTAATVNSDQSRENSLSPSGGNRHHTSKYSNDRSEPFTGFGQGATSNSFNPHGFYPPRPQNPYMAPQYPYIPAEPLQDPYAPGYYHNPPDPYHYTTFPRYQGYPYEPRYQGYQYETIPPPTYQNYPSFRNHAENPNAFTGQYNYGHSSEESSETVPRMPPLYKVPPSLRLSWRKIRRKDLHPEKQVPVLPEGWDWRIDDNNRLFYVDTYARGSEKRCFWNPPKEQEEEEEDEKHKLALYGWNKICTIFGRIFWIHRESGLISYEYPRRCAQIGHNDTGGLFLRTSPVSRDWLYWKSVDLKEFKLDDSNVECQISSTVWNTGISEEAILERGELWWGNSSVKERHLKLSKPRYNAAGSIISERSENTEEKKSGVSSEEPGEIPRPMQTGTFTTADGTTLGTANNQGSSRDDNVTGSHQSTKTSKTKFAESVDCSNVSAASFSNYRKVYPAYVEDVSDSDEDGTEGSDEDSDEGGDEDGDEDRWHDGDDEGDNITTASLSNYRKAYVEDVSDDDDGGGYHGDFLDLNSLNI